jgi:hypothetical protein
MSMGYWSNDANSIKQKETCFDVLLTVRLVIILATDQLDAQILFYNKFVTFFYMFRATSCSSSGE